MTALRTVVIGFGSAADQLAQDRRMAAYFPRATHSAILSSHPAFDWCAVVDPSADARHRAESRWQIQEVAATVEDLQTPERFDCAVVATAPHDRGGFLEALPSLRAVMLEKPVAQSLEGAKALQRACSERDIVVQVNYWRRGVDEFQALGGGSLEAQIGRPRAVFGVYGGGLRNTGSHMIDFVRLLLGEVTDASPANDVRPAADARHQGDVAASVHLTVNEEVPVRLLPIDFREYREASLDIWGASGRLLIEQESLSVRHAPLADNRGLEQTQEIASDQASCRNAAVSVAFERLYDNIVDALHGKAPLMSGLASALETERVLDAVIGGAKPQGAAA